MAETGPTLMTRPPHLSTRHKTSSPTIPTKLSSTASNPSNLQTITRSATEPGQYRKDLLEHGYVVVPNILPPHLLLASQASCKYLVSKTRPGGFWPHVRTVPKQFPPWPKYESPEQNLNIWGIQHLLHPELSGLRDVFAEVYFCKEVLQVIREILAAPEIEGAGGVTNDDLVMELFNLLISPGRNEGFELVWHRDDVRPEVTPEEEMKQLREKAPGERQLHAQYNIALFEDESLIVVPGSHRRVRTDEERNAGVHDVLSGELRVKLNPGDGVFYDSNIWHRGVYAGIDEKEELGRMTLHGSVGLKGHGEERSRQVLQHGVGEWIEKPEAGFDNIQDEEKRKVAEGMRRNLIEMGTGRGSVGYSLDG